MQTKLGRAALQGVLAVSSLAFAACNVEDESSDPVVESSEEVGEGEALGTAELPFDAGGGTGMRIAINGDINVLMGSDVGTAGFLQAIGGNISGGSAMVATDLGVNQDQMQLLMSAGPGATFRADAGIVYPGSHQYGWAFSTTSGVREERLVSAGSPRRRCYLYYVCGGGTQFFNSADDSIAIIKKTADNSWYLRMTGSACGAAACTLVDAPEYWAMNGPGTYNLGPKTPGKACWLTGVGGRFRSNDPEDGVYLRTTSTSWELVVSPGKWGGAECNF